MFHAITNQTLGEYIRNRRLTCAAEALTAKNSTVTEVAARYGYDSLDAFTKAFKRLHGTTPSKIKQGNVRLKSYPKLSLDIRVSGTKELQFRIVDKKAFKVFGIDFETTLANNALYTDIPNFCNRVWADGTHGKINQFLGFSDINLLHGISYDFHEDGRRKYMLGWETPNKPIPHEYTVLEIPKATWIVFDEKSFLSTPNEIANLWKRIYLEWFPTSGFEAVDGPSIEKYYWDDPSTQSYHYEIWIPIKHI